MHRAPFVVALVLLPLLASAQTVGVVLDFDQVPGKVPVEVMKKEVDALLKASGITLDWRTAGGPNGGASFDDLVFFKFQGRCKADSDAAAIPPGETRALGMTRVENGRVLPFSEVKCDAVRQALTYLRPEANQGERQRALGMAMGRVVAHELYHILARTTAHAARGLAHTVESLEDLVAIPEIPFRREDAEAMKEGVRSQK